MLSRSRTSLARNCPNTFSQYCFKEIADTLFLSSGMTISNYISSFPKATKGHNKESRLDSIAIRDSRYFVPQF
ncbi:conserved hypothetical protein [Vibrio chagasii]|nr:conserved hypothetical protein [Vibrio chagasii]CAH6796707.1 conserved hypothetical protein [Vibrio chagasii]CAH6819608.1 conserved hypothetical protein [Vibrio chagasii]CAH6970956.1 conserved hypothetical protein [Vibrio chagasii]CAH6992497.1 conserved hypothetical protein [Vibrio chagasii]